MRAMRTAHRFAPPLYRSDSWGATVPVPEPDTLAAMSCAGRDLAATESRPSPGSGVSRLGSLGSGALARVPAFPKDSPKDSLMLDFAAARRMMVDCQVRTSDVTDLRLIAAMQAVPRERFVPKASADLAYLDADLSVGAGRGLVKPMVLAKLLQAAEIGGADRVLVVGCATGYSAAVIAHLAAVVALEQDPDLAQLAKDNLQALGASNTTVVTGPLVGGWPAAAPYEVILLDGAVEDVPQALLRQLKEGGRLLGVVGRPPLSKALLFRSTGSESSSRSIFDATAPTLPGFAKPSVFVF
jgi:protein-L-isoaspartate(D-aspartate) O-methyltransferase